MKIALVTFMMCLLQQSAVAFVVTPRRRCTVMTTTLSMSDTPAAEDGEQGGLDLDLGEMFEMFDAADQEQDFDDAIKKVKGE